MKSLVDLQKEIQSLQKQAAQVKAREFTKTIREIVDAMAAFGITLAHLKSAIKKNGSRRGVKPSAATASAGKRRGPGRPRKTAAKTKTTGPKKTTRKAAAIKYRGPSGEAWSGRGKLPTWLRELVATGRSKDEFKVV